MKYFMKTIAIKVTLIIMKSETIPATSPKCNSYYEKMGRPGIYRLYKINDYWYVKDTHRIISMTRLCC